MIDMRILRNISERVSTLLRTPWTELGRWARFVRFQIQLWRFSVVRLHRNNVMAMSAALSFRTILAMVPVLILAFLILQATGQIEDTTNAVADVLAGAGLDQIYIQGPETAPAADPVTVADKIAEVLRHVQKQLTPGGLGPIGLVLLIWTALTLLNTLEGTLNRVFHAHRSRSILRRTLLYWSVLTLGPLMLMVVQFIFRRATIIVEDEPFLSWAVGAVGWITPAVVGILLLATLYKLMPNTQVRFRPAVLAAIVAVPAWLVIRWGFSAYVQHVARSSLYGALGLVPLFLIWLNLSWWVFLFGAELCHTLGDMSVMQHDVVDEERPIGPWLLLTTLLATARLFHRSDRPAGRDEIAGELGTTRGLAERVLEHLIDHGWVVRVEQDDSICYLLSREPGHLRLDEVLDVGAAGGSHDTVTRLDALLTPVRDRLRTGLEGMSLADLLDEQNG